MRPTPCPTGSGPRCSPAFARRSPTRGSSGRSSTVTIRRGCATVGFDSVTQYELWKAIWSSLNDGNFHELDWALVRHNEFLDDVRAFDVRRQSRRHPDRQPPGGHPAPRTCAGHPADDRRNAERLRRRRVRLPGCQGGAVRWRRRGTARIQLSADGCRRARPRRVPAAPVPDRPAQATPVAAHRAHVAAAAGQPRSTSTRRAADPTRWWWR